MKKLLLLCIFSIVVCVLHAQNAFVVPMPNYKSNTSGIKKFKPFSDTAMFKKLYRLQQSKQPVDNMPIAGMQPVQLTYIGNNGRGLDIYKAQQDGMPVLKPDSIFYSAMPMPVVKVQP